MGKRRIVASSIPLPVLRARAMAISLRNGRAVETIKNTFEGLGVPTRAYSLEKDDQLETIPAKLLAGAPTIGLVVIDLGAFPNPEGAIDTLKETVGELEIIALVPLQYAKNLREKDYVDIGASATFFQKHSGYIKNAADTARRLLRITGAEPADRTTIPATRSSVPALPQPASKTDIAARPAAAPPGIEMPVFGAASKSASPAAEPEANPQLAPTQPGEVAMPNFKERLAILKAEVKGEGETLVDKVREFLATADEMGLADVKEKMINDLRSLLPDPENHRRAKPFKTGSRDVLLAGKPITLKMGPAKVLEDLIEAAGKSVSKATLASDCSPATLYAHISAIREALTEKFGSEAADCIKVHSGEGYSLDTAGLK